MHLNRAFILLLFIPTYGFSQFCGFHNLLEHSKLQSVFQQTLSANSTELYKLNKTENYESHLEIPVVFHVVYNNEEENINDSLIVKAIILLNQCYNSTDTTKIRPIYRAYANSPKIQFVPAHQVPYIQRKHTPKKSFGNPEDTFDEHSIKYTSKGGKDAIKPEHYLNIWIGNLKPTNNENSWLLGYAFPPINAEFWHPDFFIPQHLQGVVLDYRTLIHNPPQSVKNSTWRKTIVHEIGHFLGLQHTWGDGGCNNDDFIEDTPPTSKPNISCNNNANTCFPLSLPDMIENYMDYSPHYCMNMFTKQQSELMRYNLINLRPNLYQYRSNFSNINLNNSSIRLLPNPAKDVLMVEHNIEKANLQFHQCILYNFQGQCLVKYPLTESATKIPLNELSVGLYFIQIISNTTNQMLPFVKQ